MASKLLNAVLAASLMLSSGVAAAQQLPPQANERAVERTDRDDDDDDTAKFVGVTFAVVVVLGYIFYHAFSRDGKKQVITPPKPPVSP